MLNNNNLFPNLLGIGDWAQSPIPKSQFQYKITLSNYFILIFNFYLNYIYLINNIFSKLSF